MSQIYHLVTNALEAIGAPKYPTYYKALHNALTAHMPVQEMNFFAKEYYTLAKNKTWFAHSLIENARMEGYGSEQIWKFSNRLVNPHFIDKVRLHSLDESRHSKLFIVMLKLVFPKALEDEELSASVQGLYPGYTLITPPEFEPVPPEDQIDGEEALDELIQVHLTEIRAIVLQHLLKGAIMAHAPVEVRDKISRFVESLIRDEARHIEYTARIFEQAANDGHEEFVYERLAKRQNELNDLSYEELEYDKIMI